MTKNENNHAMYVLLLVRIKKDCPKNKIKTTKVEEFYIEMYTIYGVEFLTNKKENRP
ncbi:MAG: hypothetical protein ABI855_05275 [Bacteroidota bacterium]